MRARGGAWAGLGAIGERAGSGVDEGVAGSMAGVRGGKGAEAEPVGAEMADKTPRTEAPAPVKQAPRKKGNGKSTPDAQD